MGEVSSVELQYKIERRDMKVLTKAKKNTFFQHKIQEARTFFKPNLSFRAKGL